MGGRDSCSQQISNKLWTSDDGKKWVEGGLPSMPTPRLVPFAASFGRPKCMVVAGGITSKQRKSVSVEVLNDGQWFTVEPLPQCFTSGAWHFTLHNRNLYMCKAGHQVLCCSLNTLISSSRTPTKSEVESQNPWRNINTPCDNLFLVSSKSKQLLAFSLSPDNSEVYAFSSYNQSWVHVGDSHPLLEGVRSHASMAVSVPTGDLMILRMDGYPETKAFKISANGEGGWGEGDRGEGRGGEWKGREGRGGEGRGREERGREGKEWEGKVEEGRLFSPFLHPAGLDPGTS